MFRVNNLFEHKQGQLFSELIIPCSFAKSLVSKQQSQLIQNLVEG